MRGHTSLLQRKGCAIIGARNASLNAYKLTERVAAEIGEGGFTIISGIARGIDAAAHLGSIKTGTIAVLANGVGMPYPRENTAVFSRLIEEGAALSEMPLITQPSAKLTETPPTMTSNICTSKSKPMLHPYRALSVVANMDT